MRKYILELSLLIGLVAALIGGSLASAKQSDLSDKLIRLHVIANSDSEDDQALKYKVRDRILEKVSALTADATDITDARAIIRRNLDALAETAQNEISANGYTYNAEASLENVFFPTRDYGSFALPAGEYESLRIIIGEGVGKNWWCVLFPPLCISAAEAEVEISAKAAGLSDDEIALITSDKTSYKFKFKIIEIVEKLIHKTNI